MRKLDFSDGFGSSQEPDQGRITATELKTFSNDSSYVNDKGSAAELGDVYINSTSQSVRYYNGSSWVDVNIEDTNGDAVISGDLTVNGDFEVKGTKTTINTQTLDVEDANITVNEGGNQSTADDTAGLTVEMSDATNVKLKYDKNLASKFKIGEAGSEVEVADVSSSQEFSNKTLIGDLKRGPSSSNLITEEFVPSLTLNSNETDTKINEFSFDPTVVAHLEINYHIKKDSSNVSAGTLKVICSEDGSNVDMVNYGQIAGDLTDLEFNASFNSGECEVTYTTSSDSYTMKADIKKWNV